MNSIVSLQDVRTSRQQAKQHEHYAVLIHEIGLSQQAFLQGMNLMFVTSLLVAYGALARYLTAR